LAARDIILGVERKQKERFKTNEKKNLRENAEKQNTINPSRPPEKSQYEGLRCYAKEGHQPG
jgi:hypothetical protein